MLRRIRNFVTWVVGIGTLALIVGAFVVSLTSQPTLEQIAMVTQIAVRATLTARADTRTPIVFAPPDEAAPTVAAIFPSRTPTSTASATPTSTPTSTASATPLITPATITPEGMLPTATPASSALNDTQLVSGQPGVIGQPTAVVHIVQLRESMFRIAQQYDVSVEAIIAANAVPDPNRIFVGQALLIPQGGTVQPPLQTPTTMFPAQATALAIVTSAGLSVEDLGVVTIPPTITPTIPPAPTAVNGLKVDYFVQMSDETVANIRRIYAIGKAMGRNSSAFSKLGDSTIENPFFLTRFDEGTYHLGDYLYLQSVIEHYRGSFARQGMAVRRGLHTWSVLDPMWAPKPNCAGGEHMLACEFRVHNPSILIVRMGSNDAGIPDTVDKNLREIVEFTIESGVIPVMATKADRFDGADNVNNNIIRQIAKDYHLPLWDFDLVAGTIPGRGLGPDNVHMTTFYAHDYRSSLAFRTGNGVHNLTALITLDRVWRALEGEQQP